MTDWGRSLLAGNEYSDESIVKEIICGRIESKKKRK